MRSLPFFTESERTESTPHSDEFTLNLTLLPSLTPSHAYPSMLTNASVTNFNPGISGTTVNSLTGFSLPFSWRNLRYQVGNMQILDGLTGTALPGRCLAVMGSSGAGKTTFLNAICGRLDIGGKAKLSGSCQLGDVEYERGFRMALGFVSQDDIISPMVTPYDAMWFSLRTRRGTDREETHERVMEMLQVLKLSHCKDTMVGVPGSSAGLSGGERKRCNIGTELICDPKVLLLDEPTSGLDSVTSAKLAQQLREIARLGRTIIYTIHQPTAEALSFFDDLMLLTAGRCVYHGPMADSLAYFESIGFRCPDRYTAADYFMTLLQDEQTSPLLIERWEVHLKSGKRTMYSTSVRTVPMRSESLAFKFINLYIKRFSSSMLVQLREVFLRRLNELKRDRVFIAALLVQSLYFSIMAGLIFLRLGTNTASIQDREGLLYTTISNRFMGSVYAVLTLFHRDRVSFVHEQNAGAYSPFIYLVGTLAAQLPLMLLLCLLESIIVYFLVGFYATAGAFFTYFCVMAVFQDVCVGIGVLLSACFESLTVATSMVALINLPAIYASGLFASTGRLRPYYYVFEKLSYIRHAYILLLRNELKHINHIDCDTQKYGKVFCRNQPKSGKDVLARLGFDPDPQSTDLIMWLSLFLIWGILRIFTIIALTVISRRKK